MYPNSPSERIVGLGTRVTKLDADPSRDGDNDRGETTVRALIAVLPGDGVGPEVTEQAVRVLKTVARSALHELEVRASRIGGAALERDGCPLPPQTKALCGRADATLLGAVGESRWADEESGNRPEDGILELRRHLGVFANLRPVRSMLRQEGNSPVKSEAVAAADLIFVRELSDNFHNGCKDRGADAAVDKRVRTLAEIRRIVRVACEIARGRRRRLTSIDRANVLPTSRLWRATTERMVVEEYPDITLDHLLADAAATTLVERPSDFDVIVADNMCGDILSDAASVLTGGFGNLPSASLGADGRGLYESGSGSAPDVGGRGVANPVGAMLSAAMLLRHSLGLRAEAAAVETAVASAIEEEVGTTVPPGQAAATTDEVGGAVLRHLDHALAPRTARVTRSIRW